MRQYYEQLQRLSPFRIALIYFFVAGVWVFFSDEALEYAISDPALITKFQTYKGLFYILFTTVGLYWLIQHHRSERKDLEVERYLDQELMNKLFERIPVMITVYDPGLDRFVVNRAFEEVIGWSTAEANEIDLMAACYPDPDYREKVREFMNRPEKGWVDFMVTKREGGQVYCSWTNIRLSDETQVGIGIDLTDLKESEAEMRESRRLLRNTFESLEESVMLVEPGSRIITDTNRATEKIFGYSREELIGESTRKLHVNEEMYHEFDRMGTKELSETGMFKTEFRMKKKSGEIINTDHTVTLVYDEEGEIDRVVSVIQDITERKRNQEELKNRTQFIETTLQNLPIGVAVNTIDDGKTTLMNDKFSEIYGWPEEKLSGVEDFFECVYPDEEFRQQMMEQVMTDLESGDPERMNWENVPITTQNGTEKYVDNRAIPLPDQNLMISTVIDVTDRKHLEEQLRESEAKYRHLFENNPEPMWIYDPDTLAFVEVNRAAVEHYGYSEEEFLEMTLLDIRPGGDYEAVKEDVVRHAGENSYSEEWTHIKKDGSRIDVEVSAADVRYKERTYRLVLVNDVTQRKRLQERIIQSVIEAEERERRRIARELHDGIGQYLSASHMNMEAVKREAGHLSEKSRSRFETGLSLLKKAIGETRNTAHNLMPHVLEDYGLELALQTLVEKTGEGRGIELVLESEIDDTVLDKVTSFNLYRIVQEAINNAIKHGKCSKISIKVCQGDDLLACTISDNGIGAEIDEAQAGGIGIRNMKSRVQSMSGTIAFQSKAGEGMRIDIRIPLSK